MHRYIPAFAFTFAMCAGAAGAHSSDEFPPAMTTGGQIIFVAHHGGKRDVTSGLNALDDPKTLVCGSANGCLVSFSAEVNGNLNAEGGICAYVDSQSALPQCGAYTNTSLIVSRQVAKVSAGQHVVQTFLWVSTGGGGKIIGWEADYTVYQIGQP